VRGPALVFDVLPRVFTEIPGGRIIGTLFFVLLVLAATTPSEETASVAGKGDDATFMVSVLRLLLSVALRKNSPVRLALEKPPSNSMSGFHYR